MPAQLLDGLAISRAVREEVAKGVGEFQGRTGESPGLAAVLVGDDPASQVYVRNKRRACVGVGMREILHRLPAETSQERLLSLIDELNADPRVDGILVQLPLPGGIDERTVIERIDPGKDVDGFHPTNVGRLWTGSPTFVPCTPLGIREMLIRSGVVTQGRHAVILGRSKIVGRPMAALLSQKGPGGDATVTIAHTRTLDVAAVAREAEILVVAAGRPLMVQGDWIRPGAVVIDVGIHKLPDGSLCGDVDTKAASEVASMLTPVPGGVGPMTVAMLLHNTLLAARRRRALA